MLEPPEQPVIDYRPDKKKTMMAATLYLKAAKSPDIDNAQSVRVANGMEVLYVRRLQEIVKTVYHKQKLGYSTESIKQKHGDEIKEIINSIVFGAWHNARLYLNRALGVEIPYDIETQIEPRVKKERETEDTFWVAILGASTATMALSIAKAIVSDTIVSTMQNQRGTT